MRRSNIAGWLVGTGYFYCPVPAGRQGHKTLSTLDLQEAITITLLDNFTDVMWLPATRDQSWASHHTQAVTGGVLGVHSSHSAPAKHSLSSTSSNGHRIPHISHRLSHFHTFQVSSFENLFWSWPTLCYPSGLTCTTSSYLSLSCPSLALPVVNLLTERVQQVLLPPSPSPLSFRVLQNFIFSYNWQYTTASFNPQGSVGRDLSVP